MMDDKHPIGKIKISNTMLRDNWRELTALFAKFVPVNIYQEFTRDVTSYTGYSEMFDLIDKGAYVPTYQITFHRDVNGVIDVSVER